MKTEHIQGFRVAAHAPLSRGFVRGLTRLHERGFADPACTVVKTKLWDHSGVTHEGGRYLHPSNPRKGAVIQEMARLGMEAPPLPFLVAPGEATLYHEWGHHVDRCWGDDPFTFSCGWFSQFYRPGFRTGRGLPLREPGRWLEALILGLAWRLASSELFADLFEDWMRGDKRVAWDCCEMEMDALAPSVADLVLGAELVSGVTAAAVRAQTYALFEPGIRSRPPAVPLPDGDLLCSMPFGSTLKAWVQAGCSSL